MFAFDKSLKHISCRRPLTLSVGCAYPLSGSSTTDSKQELGPLGGSFFGRGLVVGYTDKRSPYVNAIANDAGVALKGREFFGLWVYELGNALSIITGFSPDTPADAAARYGVAGESGAAFSDCVFGGALTSSGSGVRPGG